MLLTSFLRDDDSRYMQEERPAPGNDEGPCSIGNGFQMLQVNTRKLKIEDELRRIFGSKFINSGKYDEDEGAIIARGAPLFKIQIGLDWA